MNSANVTDPVTGGSAINLPVDVISEVSVLSNPYDVQYGKFAGAVSTVHTQVSDFDKFRFKSQNFMPRMRRRDGDIIGIESATPRLKLSGPVVKGRLALTQSFEYRFIRTEIKGAGLPNWNGTPNSKASTHSPKPTSRLATVTRRRSTFRFTPKSRMSLG